MGRNEYTPSSSSSHDGGRRHSDWSSSKTTNRLLCYIFIAICVFGVFTSMAILIAGIKMYDSSAAMQKMIDATQRTEERFDKMERRADEFYERVDMQEIDYWIDAVRYARRHDFLHKSVDAVNDLPRIQRVFNESSVLLSTTFEQYVRPLLATVSDDRWQQYAASLHAVNWTHAGEQLVEWTHFVEAQRPMMETTLQRASQALDHFNRISTQLEAREVVRLVSNTTAHLVAVVEYMEHVVEKIRTL